MKVYNSDRSTGGRVDAQKTLYWQLPLGLKVLFAPFYFSFAGVYMLVLWTTQAVFYPLQHSALEIALRVYGVLLWLWLGFSVFLLVEYGPMIEAIIRHHAAEIAAVVF